MCGTVTVARGLAYAKQGRVVELELSDDGTDAKAWVTGSNGQTYTTHTLLSTVATPSAGRLDLRGSLGSECDDAGCLCHEAEGVGILDAKTGSIFESAHGQVQGYRLLSASSGFGPAEWGGLLDLNGDGTYQLIRAEGTIDDFADALVAYRAAGRIRAAARKAWKARQ